jgi:hypothetical protein
MASDFEEFLAPRLEAVRHKDDAAEVTLELWDGRRLEDAVLDAIESLPAQKTRRLRAWVEQASDYSEWRNFERRGWEIINKEWRSAFPRKGERFTVVAPADVDLFESLAEKSADRPSAHAVAAAVGATEVSFVGGRPGGRAEYLYQVRRVA